MFVGLIKGSAELCAALSAAVVQLGLERTAEIMETGDGLPAKLFQGLMPPDGDLLGALAVPVSLAEAARAMTAIGIAGGTFVVHGLPYGVICVVPAVLRVFFDAESIANAPGFEEDVVGEKAPNVVRTVLSRGDEADACTT